jgi:V/A-type H+-transporting ATPase subunit I
MKVDVEKWIFAGAAEAKEYFFAQAQNLGIIEFTSKISPKLHFQHDCVNQVMEALKVLSSLLPEKDLNFKKPVSLPCEQIVERLLELRKEKESLLSAVKEWETERQRMLPWGQFSREALARLTQDLGYAPQLVVFPSNVEEKYPYLFKVFQIENMGYGLWISQEPLDQEIESFYWEKDPLEIEKALQAAKEGYHKVELELACLKNYEEELRQLLFRQLEKVHFDWSLECSGAALDARLFYVEGWVPADQEKALGKLLEETQVWGQKTLIEENEVQPTYLKNGALGKIGQDLVGIYDVPASHDKDPSLWVLVFFALFFSMIIGDAGYGMIFLGLSLGLHWKYPDLKGLVLRVKRLAMLLSVCCIFWGFFTCSYWGLSFAPSHPLKQASLLHQLSLKKVAYHVRVQDSVYHDWVKRMPQIQSLEAEDPQKIVEEGYTGSKDSPNYEILSGVNDALLKEFALFIGAFHLILSLGRYALRTWSSWGWMLFIISGWFYFPAVVQATTFVNYGLGIDPQISTDLGLQLLYLSLFLAFGASILQNKIYGLLEVMNLIQVFSDVLSYLRLYALGLAGGIMSATFNDLAAQTGLLPGLIIIGAGHLVNLVLGVMGGVVHGLRLNFLEWYHYSFSGAGRWFRPLKKIDETSH